MTLLDLPIPPRPDVFAPYGAPPGVAVDFDAFRSSTGGAWWPTRPTIRPRLLLIHTNGASREGKIPSQVNWANAAPDNTHPHYCVNAPQPTKFVPSDRKGIGNYRVSDWSIVVETADAGWPTPGNAGGFLYDHAEITARIVAYESIVAQVLGVSMPIIYPSAWDGPGVACHTEPFGYPYWTNSVGKACPGDTKKRQVRDEIMPRARQIRDAWLNPQPPEDPDMATIGIVRRRNTADQFALVPIASAEQARRMGIDGQQPVVIDCDLAALEAAVGYQLTPKAGD